MPDRERMRRSGLPSRTYEAAHKRAQANGWLVERYVPNPILFGKPRLTIALGRPADDLIDECVSRWASLPGLSLLWKGAHSMLGAFLSPPSPTPTMIAQELQSENVYSSSFSVELDLRTTPILAYFDFEAEWEGVVGPGGTEGYPRALPLLAPRFGTKIPAVPARWRDRIREIVTSCERDTTAGGTKGKFYRLGRRGVIRRAIEVGWIEPRNFLNPCHMPEPESWELKQVAYAYGQLKPGQQPNRLLSDLVQQCDFTPFLFASNGTALIIGSLSPRPPRLRGRGRLVSVRTRLETALQNLEVVREDVFSLRAPVNHRYGDLVTSHETVSGHPAYP